MIRKGMERPVFNKPAGVETEVPFAPVRDEFGPALLAQHDGQPLGR